MITETEMHFLGVSVLFLACQRIVRGTSGGFSTANLVSVLYLFGGFPAQAGGPPPPHVLAVGIITGHVAAHIVHFVGTG